ncbi:hypothetical protein MIMGU_mgv1a016725mg [Erythranthe guttata]|uniref:Uncharacterized protein n=1 Tax=Erythranthe guttata TaxID=4155 RepID=A0A022QL15_ERYGU|nr:hypothetical protein MIMGU_mgv1a016725mg [Erythranthe guttata]
MATVITELLLTTTTMKMMILEILLHANAEIQNQTPKIPNIYISRKKPYFDTSFSKYISPYHYMHIFSIGIPTKNCIFFLKFSIFDFFFSLFLRLFYFYLKIPQSTQYYCS